MDQQWVQERAASNLRGLADAVEAGRVRVVRLSWRDTGNVVIHPSDREIPTNDDMGHEQEFTVRYWPVKAEKA